MAFYTGWLLVVGATLSIVLIGFVALPALLSSNDDTVHWLLASDPVLWVLIGFLALAVCLQFFVTKRPDSTRFNPNLHPIAPVDISQRRRPPHPDAHISNESSPPNMTETSDGLERDSAPH